MSTFSSDSSLSIPRLQWPRIYWVTRRWTWRGGTWRRPDSSRAWWAWCRRPGSWPQTWTPPTSPPTQTPARRADVSLRRNTLEGMISIGDNFNKLNCIGKRNINFRSLNYLLIDISWKPHHAAVIQCWIRKLGKLFCTVYRLHDKKPGLKNRFIRTACADYIFTGRCHVSIYSTWPAWPAVLFMCSLQFTGFKGTVTRDFRALVFKNYLRKQNKQMFSFYFLPQTFFSKTRLFLCTVIENALLFQGSNKYKSS